MITADSRDPKRIALALLSRFPEKVVVKAIQGGGDYRLEREGRLTLIERKEANDLVTSATTYEEVDGQRISKLRRQLGVCREAGADPVVLIVEGELREDPVTGYLVANGKFRKVRYQTIVRLLVDLQKEGVVVLPTSDQDNSAQLIACLYETMRRPIK